MSSLPSTRSGCPTAPTHRSVFLRHPRRLTSLALFGLTALPLTAACSGDDESGSGVNGGRSNGGDSGGPEAPIFQTNDGSNGGPTTSTVFDGDVEGFDGSPVDAVLFDECAGVTQETENASRPVDVIFVVDNSSSMDGEIRQIQARINEDFADIIEASGVDYRVIMISRFGDIDEEIGDSDNPICIGGALGDRDCSNAASAELSHNPPRFYHYSTDVRSREPWCRILEGWDTPDELASDERPGWSTIAPDGYQAFLRQEAFKSFIVITDDVSHCGPDVERGPFRDVGGEPFTFNFDDQDSVAGGQQSAELFDQALLSLSPQHFGTADNRNYNFYSIVGMPENNPGDAPWQPGDGIQTGTCGPGSEGPATGFQALSVLTGGLRWPSCRNDDFNAMFRAIAGGVIQGSLSCEWTIPDAPAGQTFDTAKVNLVYTPADGAKKLGFFVQEQDCELGGWYFDDNASPSVVIACPETCEVLQSDAAGRVDVLFGCGRVDSIR